MAEIFKFFNSNPAIDDRRFVQAADFANYFSQVLSTGIISIDNEAGLRVTADGTNMQTTVDVGGALMEGYQYTNTTPLQLTHDLPEADTDRIDRVVLRLDKSAQNRFIRAFIVKGEPSATPEPPELTRTSLVYELSLAQVYLTANTSTIPATDVTDERLDEELCGIVSSLITIPTSQFLQEWETYFTGLQASLDGATDEYEQEIEDARAQLQQDLLDFEQEFRDWFDQQQTEGFVLASEKGQPGGVETYDDAIAHKEEFTQHEGKTVTEAHEPLFGAYREEISTVSGTGTVTLNADNSPAYRLTMAGTTTLNLSTTSSEVVSLSVFLEQGGTAHPITFSSAIKWRGGEIPDVSEPNFTYALTFITYNGGTTWLGFLAGDFDVS
ncbi:hypothetical protein FLK61_34075 [Paenalkalicoccus suaedae]|uniref:Uncharacterized protein n=1 Tax=Paenalkalicoccus suaedae TaxID=2592382 RepID=A0A859FHH2_9BACI|nr:hypothetical protein [Paenalkalicoccus suaedae]QKS71655.1 hypothetical protein FLK61_33780 [Paenalkalicoccus suaedae]QKS71709.1 hypothetical protein FLK61_34075 [Paenalkalicoccus suaedae]